MMTVVSPEPASALEGTGFVLRLHLRLDRVRIAVWALSFFLLIFLSVVAIDQAYPTQAALDARASLMASPAAIMMTGPAFSLDDYTFGAMLANELSLWTFLPAAIMSILLMVRHTRQDEEASRMEALLALPIGRYAPVTAAFLTVSLANLAITAAVAGGLIAAGQPMADSVAFGVAAGLTGLVFGAVAAVSAQAAERSRTATASALAVLGLAALIRGVGDVIEPHGSALSWLSPLAWAQQTRLYVDLRWWPLLLSAAAVVLLLSAAAVLARRRDLGSGLVQTQPGPAHADRALLSPVGLARRLLTRQFVGWSAGLFLFAVAFGSLADSMDGLLEDNPTIAQWVPISSDDISLSFASVILALLAIAPVALFVSSVLQLTGEEHAGRVEEMIATGSSRSSLLAGWTAVAAIWSAIAMVSLGLGTGIGLAYATGRTASMWELTAASLAYIPAIVLCGAVTAALYGALPRLTALAWILVLFISLEMFLGDLLQLPSWVEGLSPLARTPLVPFAELEPAPLLVMSALALAFFAAALAGFRRRDLPAL